MCLACFFFWKKTGLLGTPFINFAVLNWPSRNSPDHKVGVHIQDIMFWQTDPSQENYVLNVLTDN